MRFRGVQLTQGFQALVDEADYERVVALGPWCAEKQRNTTYAVSSRRKYLHHVVLGVKLVDHVNGNGLDNRRENLRPSSRAQNAWNSRKPSNNTSGFKGVSWHKGMRAWRARVTKNGVTYVVGYYSSPEIADEACRDARRDLHGAFARDA